MKLYKKHIGRKYYIGGGWGDAIDWFNIPKRKVVGWKCSRPEKGDWLLCKTQSGKTGIFIFKVVEYCKDPPDMFFADVEDVGYED